MRSSPGWALVLALIAFPLGAQPSRGLIFAAPAEGSTVHLYVAGSDGSSPYVLAPHQGVDAYPTWTPDSAHVVFVSDRSGYPDFYVSDPHGVVLKPVNIPAPSRSAQLAAPDVSSDGSHLAYHVEDGPIADVWIAGIDGSLAVNLTREQGHSRYPDWSPDGRTIYFESDRNGETALYRMNRDGSHTERLTQGEQPAISPDGATLAYSREGALWVSHADGQNPRVLAGLGEQPTWSPDGAKLAFVVREGESTHLYTISADGSGQRLTPLPYEGVRQPAW